MKEIDIIDITPDTIAQYGVCGYKDVAKHLELRRKIAWFTENYPKGLRRGRKLSDHHQNRSEIFNINACLF